VFEGGRAREILVGDLPPLVIARYGEHSPVKHAEYRNRRSTVVEYVRLEPKPLLVPTVMRMLQVPVDAQAVMVANIQRFPVLAFLLASSVSVLCFSREVYSIRQSIA
jgi:hypothetical protein